MGDLDSVGGDVLAMLFCDFLKFLFSGTKFPQDSAMHEARVPRPTYLDVMLLYFK